MWITISYIAHKTVEIPADRGEVRSNPREVMQQHFNPLTSQDVSQL